jgi:hypothetical protein
MVNNSCMGSNFWCNPFISCDKIGYTVAVDTQGKTDGKQQLCGSIFGFTLLIYVNGAALTLEFESCYLMCMG